MSTEKPTFLYLIRHGATEANERVPYILQGNAIDLPLSPTGERQAVAVADFLRTLPITRLYSSAMRRATQTAQAIGSSLGLSLIPLEKLHECNVGHWEGKDWGTIQREFPNEHAQFAENPAVHPYFGGESYGNVFERVRPVLDQLLIDHAGEHIAVVTHNVVNRVYAAHLLGLEIRLAAKLRQANGCINLVRRHAGRTELLTYNSTFHLGAPRE